MRQTLALALLVAITGRAAADAKSKDKADTLFKQGKKLMSEKKYADACTAFEQSFKLDPGIGGELNIARCYEEWGKLGRALKAYQQAEQMAKDASDPRAPKIHDLVAGLDPQVPRVTLKLPKGGDGAQAAATIDGEPVAAGALGTASVVDPGPHTIEYAAGGARKKKVIAVERGGAVEITLDGVAVVAEQAHPDKPDGGERTPAPADPGRTRRIAGIATGGAGIALVGIASYMTLSARSSYKDALSQHCGGMTNACDDTGLKLTHDARSEANVATFVFIAGAAAVAGGVVLYVLAPKPGAGGTRDEHALYVVPQVSPTGGGLVVGGGF